MPDKVVYFETYFIFIVVAVSVQFSSVLVVTIQLHTIYTEY